MDLRHLRQFTAIVDRGGFARAAQFCNVSQPAMSASIRQLEEGLGVTLLERGAFGARPTSAGKGLYRRAKLILSEVDRAIDEVAVIRAGEGGRVAVGIGPLFEHTIMPQVVAEFVRRRPRVSVLTAVGITSELLDQLARGELDFTISSPPGWHGPPPGIEFEVLQRTHDVVIAAVGHPIWDACDFSLAALARHPWVLSARVTDAADNFFTTFTMAGLTPPSTLLRTDSIPILKSLVLEQNFLCMVSTHFAEPLLATSLPSVGIVPIDHFKFPRQICLATRSAALPSRTATELAALVRAGCKKAIIK